jgi:DHA2 family multidrug resistance protein
MCLIFLPADEKKDASAVAPIDWFGIGLLTAGLGALQTVLEEGETDDWFDSRFICVFSAIAAVALVTFVIREMTTDAPVVDLRVLRYRSLWSGSIMSVVVGMALYGALFAIPIFAQATMGYTAQQTGMLLLPGALASAVAFPLAARLLAFIDPRVMLAGGALILVGSVLQLAQLSPLTGYDQLFWPLIFRSIGTVFMFLPLNMATLGPLPKKEISAASGFFNLTRQLGGSVGVALLTTLLARRNMMHRTVLVEKLTSGSAVVEERLAIMSHAFSGPGVSLVTARAKATAALDVLVNHQASILSFADTFYATALLIVCSLPLILLLGKPSKGEKVDVGGH